MIAADLVTERGVDSLTVRKVAEAAGYSTSIVSHYFVDKADLVLSTYKTAAARSTVRFEAAVAAKGAGLLECLEALLPLDDDRRRDWRLFYAFWGVALSDPALAEVQRDRTRSARTRVERQLERERDAGRCRADIDVARVARRILALVQGIAMQALFDPTDWTPTRQRRFLAEELREVIDVTPKRARR